MDFILKPIEKIITVNSFNDAIDAVREPGFVFSGEMHDFWEVVFVESGFVTASAEEQIFNLRQGELLFHKPNEFHRIHTNGEKAAHLLILSFCASGVLMNDFAKKCYMLNEEERQNYLETFALVKKACESYDGAKIDPYLSSKASAALEFFLLGLKDKNTSEQKPHSPNEKRYKEIITVMQKHSSEWLNVNDIAALCHMSPSNMKRIFSLYCDIGISKYFLNLKLRKACKMLLDGMSIVEVSTSLNFCSVNYFHTVFKREIGVTPSNYILKK